eukprot:scaffold32195_cov21-Tisochrysis_lutea.AAC.1
MALRLLAPAAMLLLYRRVKVVVSALKVGIEGVKTLQQFGAELEVSFSLSFFLLMYVHGKGSLVMVDPASVGPCQRKGW